MECFIKKIFIGKTDEICHKQFVRYGKGIFAKRALLNLDVGGAIKVRGSFEWANEFVYLVSELAEVKISGIVLSKELIEGLNGKKKGGLYGYEFSGNSSEVKKIADKAYATLLDAAGNEIDLKIKKRLPKPGKSGEGKINDKFCQLEAGLKYWPKIKEAFFWDLPECKKVKIEHEYIINEIVLPKDEKDFAMLRVLAKRKGKLVRKIVVDGREISREVEMEV